MERDRSENRERRCDERGARLVRGAAERADMRVVRVGRREAGIGREARRDVRVARRGGRSDAVQRLRCEEGEEGGGGDRRNATALRGQRRQAEAAFFAGPDTAFRTRRFSARPSGGSFASAVPSR